MWTKIIRPFHRINFWSVVFHRFRRIKIISGSSLNNKDLQNRRKTLEIHKKKTLKTKFYIGSPNLLGHPFLVFGTERRHFFVVGWAFFKPPTLSCLWSLGSKSFLLSLFVLLLLPALYPMKAQLSYLRQRQAWAKTPCDDNNSQLANNSGRVARRRSLETPANGDAKHGPLLLLPNNGNVRTWRLYFPYYSEHLWIFALYLTGL